MWTPLSIKRTITSTTLPFTLQEVKTWITVDEADDDTLLTSMLIGAVQVIENYTNTAIFPSSVTYRVKVTSEGEDSTTFIPLPWSNSITGFTKDGQSEAFAGGDYETGYGTFNLAYTTNYSLPEALKQAIKMEVAERYAHRGENIDTSGISEGAKAIAFPYKNIWI